MLRLTYFPANDAYAFHFGDAMLRMEDASGPHPLFFSERDDAVEAARQCGLHVDPKGGCHVVTLTSTVLGG